MEKKHISIYLMYKKCCKILNIIHISVWLFFVCSFGLSAENNKEHQKEVSVHMRNTTIGHVFSEIEKSTDFVFLVADDAVTDLNRRVTINTEKKPIAHVLDALLQNTDLDYHVVERQVSVFRKKEYPLSATVQQEPNKGITVKGSVTDMQKNPLPGVSILIKGTTRGIATDIDGLFTLSDLEPDAILEVSYVGMKPQSIAVNGRTKLSIVMTDDESALNEVVVTGYQTISKERATGAFDIIKQDFLNKPGISLASKLTGSVAGLQASHDAEGNVRFSIRGQSSILTNANPLVVVDGFPIEGSFNSINPNDVAGVSVLKDAATASIWGARATNGVIVVTTKKAKKGQSLRVTASVMAKISARPDLDYLLNQASSAEIVDFEKMQFGKWGNTLVSNDLKKNIYQYRSQAATLYNEYRLGNLTEAQMNEALANLKHQNNREQMREHLFQTPFLQQYNIGISGATEKMSNNISFMYEHDRKAGIKNKTQNLMANYRSNIALFKWLDINLSTMLQYKNGNTSGISIANLRELAPYDMLINTDGSLTNVNTSYYRPLIERNVPKMSFPYADWTYNPITEINNREFTDSRLNTRLHAGLTLKPLEGLTFESKMQYELFKHTYRNLNNEHTWMVRKTVNEAASWNRTTQSVTPNLPTGSILDSEQWNIRTYNLRNQLTFNRLFAYRHQINFLAGIEISETQRSSQIPPRAYGYNDNDLTVGVFPNGPGGFPNSIFNWLGRGQTFNYVNRYGESTDRFLSLYANAAYTFDNKYTLSGSLRNDASNFISDDPQYRYSPFWSVGMSWNLGEEPFLKEKQGVDMLKLRVTFGYNGNSDNSTSFKPLMSMTGVNQYTGEMIGILSSKGNPTLRWEKTNILNIGIDFSLLSGLLSGKIDFYNKHGKDILAEIDIPMAHGSTREKINNAEIRNRGIEIELNSQHNIYGNKIRWRGNLNVSYNQNKILKLFRSSQPHWVLVGRSGSHSYVEGYDANELWSYVYGGVQNIGTANKPNMQPVIKMNDGTVNGFANLSVKDGLLFCQPQGTLVAPYTLGMMNSFDVYDFTFSFLLTGKFGHVFRRTGFNYPTLSEGSYANKMLSEVLQADGSHIVPLPSSDNDRIYSNYAQYAYYMDYLTESANHMRLTEVNLSYDIPSTIIRKAGIINASIYIQGNNLLLIKRTKYDEDPEFKRGNSRWQPSCLLGLKLEL